MVRSPFGSLQEFHPDAESMTTYLKRTSAHITANSIDAAKQVPVLLIDIGAKTYVFTPVQPHRTGQTARQTVCRAI